MSNTAFTPNLLLSPVHSQLMVLLIYLNTRQKSKSNLGLLFYPHPPKSNHLVLMVLPLHFLRETTPFSPSLPQIPSFRPAAFLTSNTRKAYKVLVNFKHYSLLQNTANQMCPQWYEPNMFASVSVFVILFPLPGMLFQICYYIPSFSEMLLRYHIHQKTFSRIPMQVKFPSSMI